MTTRVITTANLRHPIAAAFLCGCLLTANTNATASRLFGVQDVMDCVALNNPDGSFSHDADIEVRDNSGKQRQMQARILGQHDGSDLRLNIRLLSPGNVAGTAVLLRERGKQGNDIRLYLPALDRIRYISDAMSGTKLFDTDFSYADLRQLHGDFADGDTRYLGISKWQGRNAHELRMLPVATNQQNYAALITRVDTETCVITGIDFLDSTEQPRRQLVADPRSFTEVDGRHFAQRYEMTDLLQSSSTSLSIKRIQIDSKLPKNAFDPASFYRDPPVETADEPAFDLDSTPDERGLH